MEVVLDPCPGPQGSLLLGGRWLPEAEVGYDQGQGSGWYKGNHQGQDGVQVPSLQ